MTLENGQAAPEAASAPSESASAESASAAETPQESAPKPEETPAPAPKKDPDSAKFAALARREKAAQEAAQRVKQAEADLQRRQAEIEAKAKDFEERFKKAQDPSLRPVERALALGITPEEINRDVLGGWAPPEKDPIAEKLSPLQQQMEELRKQNEELRKQVEAEAQQARQHKAHQDYLKFVDAVKQTIDLHGDKYEYIALNGKDAIDLVQETMVSYYQQNNGALLSYEEACDLVEEHFESQAEKFAKAKKLQTKFAAPQQQTKQEPPAKAKDEPVTLTADMSAASHENVDITKMSEREQLAYIAKLMTLKK